ncbi:MAG: M48 family metallopeptidase [Candidatus Eisenbacteria bacterium]
MKTIARRRIALQRVPFRMAMVLLLGLLCACSRVPLTGRQQLNLIPASQINGLAAEQYQDFLAAHELSDDRQATVMVKRVGQNIQRAVERFYAERGEQEALREYEWEFNLVADDQVNAFCMPGGKVVVYSGILPIAQGDAGLAAVMGHEIAHAIAHHGNERMSQAMIAQLGGMALEAALQQKPEQTRSLFMAAYGVGAQVGILLPYSRMHESEADHLGLIFMAMAGYDPHAAVTLWQRMSEQQGGAAPPEFLSTHPADDTRIRDLQARLPEAMQYYKSR